MISSSSHCKWTEKEVRESVLGRDNEGKMRTEERMTKKKVCLKAQMDRSLPSLGPDDYVFWGGGLETENHMDRKLRGELC